jgi:hypothetical protein
MNAFDPLRMNFDPSRFAIVLNEAASDPDPGSVRQ